MSCKKISIGAWVFYFDVVNGFLPKHDDANYGKWMYFFSNRTFVQEVCKRAINQGIVLECKHSNAENGVACFYLDYHDTDGHRRLIQFFLDNDLIPKRENGDLSNISFKLDSQTRAGEYGNDFKPAIRLSDFVDLCTREWRIRKTPGGSCYATNPRKVRKTTYSVTSLEEMLFEYDFFRKDKVKIQQWKPFIQPTPNTTFFRITSDKVFILKYTGVITGYGTYEREKLESITIAFRDGKTEYELFDAEIERLSQKRKSKITSALLEETSRIKELFEPFVQHPPRIEKRKSFEEYLVYTDYKAADNDGETKYVVLDVETNGLRTKDDDLLSVTIFNPYTGVCYNRLLPLDLQPMVLTTFINGLTDEDLYEAAHITQAEVNDIIDFFKLKEVTILSFSGGKGLFDATFIQNYCSRHGISGFENLKYENIKSHVPKIPHAEPGSMSKDSLCNAFGIKGVMAIHSGINDCILEWKLFERIRSLSLFVFKKKLFSYNQHFVLPLNVVHENLELLELMGLSSLPAIAYLNQIAEITVDSEDETDLRYLQSILYSKRNGLFLSLLNAQLWNDEGFEEKNITNIKHIDAWHELSETDIRWSFNIAHSKPIETPIPFRSFLHTVADMVKGEVFGNQKIYCEEIVFSENKKIYEKCDFSSKGYCLKIMSPFDMDNDSDEPYCLFHDEYGVHFNEEYSRYLHFTSNGRPSYVLTFYCYVKRGKDSFRHMVKGISAKLYKIEFKYLDHPQTFCKLLYDEREVLSLLLEDNSLTSTQIGERLHYSKQSVKNTFQELKAKGYITREGGSNQLGVWRILKDVDGCPVPEEKQVIIKPKLSAKQIRELNGKEKCD